MLLPREHGAYAQLLFPLLCALLVGHPRLGAYLLAVAAAGAFLAHESLLVVLGQRGIRATREQGGDARRSLAIFGGTALVAGGAALVVLPAEALVALALPVVLAALVGAAVVAHRERSTGGEALVGLALASMAVPLTLAGEAPRLAAHTIFAVFSAVFVTATVGVRSMIGRVSKAGGPHPAVAVVVPLGCLVALAWLAVTRQLSPVSPFAALPVCAVALGLTAKPPSPRHLRVVGWTLVTSTALAAVLLVSALW
mgnify:CR=1 FL=1